MSFDPAAYWEMRLRQEYSLAGVGHLSFGEGFNRIAYEARASAVKRLIRRHVRDPARARVLDVGSGTGFYLRLWRGLGTVDLTGCDMTQVAVERLRAGEGVPVQQWAAGSPGAFPFTGSFDAISCMDVLFHIVDDDPFHRALRQFHDLLAPTGRLFFSDLFLQHAQAPVQAHFRCRSLKEYEAALGGAGLRVIDRRPLLYLLNGPGDSRSPLLWRWWTHLERLHQRDPAAAERRARRVLPLEKLLLLMAREGPSSEVMVCARA